MLGVVWFHNFNINLQILFSNCFLEDFHLIVQNVLLIWPCIRDIVDDSLQHNQFVKLAFHISYVINYSLNPFFFRAALDYAGFQ